MNVINTWLRDNPTPDHGDAIAANNGWRKDIGDDDIMQFQDSITAIEFYTPWQRLTQACVLVGISPLSTVSERDVMMQISTK